jgi:hypothetical protein
MDDREIVAALRAFPRAIMLAMNGTRRLTWQEFCDAHDRYEEAIVAVLQSKVVADA